MKRIPSATYRLQFNRDFTFEQAGEILDYLRDLGISDVYASPLFQAGPQSTHGYDTCCFGKVNPNLGSLEDFERLTGALKKGGLGLLLDLVPNHMSATLSNGWWLDVLENGRESPYAPFFDIDWRPNKPALHDKVLLPVLEDHYAKVLESGKLRLTFHDGKLFIAYHDRNFPVNLPAVAAIGIEDPTHLMKHLNGQPGNARSFDKLDALIQRQHYRLAYWRVASEEINYRRFFDVTEMVALKMELPEVFRETHQLVFDWLKQGKVTGLRIDHPDGLWDPKEYLQRLQRENPPYVVVEKILSGAEQLPSDWPADGTTGYDFLNRANGLFVDAANASAFDEIYRDFTGDRADFAATVHHSRTQVLERSFASELNSMSHRLKVIASRTRRGRDLTFAELHRGLAELAASFPVYRTYVTGNATEISAHDREVIQTAIKTARQRKGLKLDQAVFDFIERLLLLQLGPELDESASKAAREFTMKFQQLTGPAMAKGLEDTAFYRFNRLVSLNEVGGDPGRFGVSPEEFHTANILIAKHWPHTLLASATHDTKRGEDVRARLDVLSEMPTEWRGTIKHWSELNHDKKTPVENASAPDANAEYLFYQTVVGAWPVEGTDNRKSRKPLADIEPAHQSGPRTSPPSPIGCERTGVGDRSMFDVAEVHGEEVVGAQGEEHLKEFRTRVAEFMLKGAKEAKINTSWTEPNPAYEKALKHFVERVLSHENKAFLDDLRGFARRVAFFGRFNSLSQTLLKITSPGVPDFYQGAELWDLSLVDPDNRRPVDYVTRRKILAELKRKFAEVQDGGGNFFSTPPRAEQPGTMKLFLIWRALNFRGTQRDLFDRGNYIPLSVLGKHQDHVCAFMRKWNGRTAVVIVPRLVFGLMRGVELPPMDEVWVDTRLQMPDLRAGDLLRNVLTREIVPAVEQKGNAALALSQALKKFPVALLEKI